MQIEQLTFYNTIKQRLNLVIRFEKLHRFAKGLNSPRPHISLLIFLFHIYFSNTFFSSDCWDFRQLIYIFLFKMHWFHGNHVVMILETGATMQANISLDFAVYQENWHAFQAFLASEDTSSATVSRGIFLSSFVSVFLVSSSKCSWISSTGSLQ